MSATSSPSPVPSPVRLIRQGDVMLRRIADPAPGTLARTLDATGQPLRGLRVEGERTGHAHELEGRVYDIADGPRVLLLERPTDLTHHEHAAITVPAGWWEVRLQREWTPTMPSRTSRRID